MKKIIAISILTGISLNVQADVPTGPAVNSFLCGMGISRFCTNVPSQTPNYHRSTASPRASDFYVDPNRHKPGGGFSQGTGQVNRNNQPNTRLGSSRQAYPYGQNRKHSGFSQGR